MSQNQLLKKACEWRKQGKQVCLATVINTWGSAPCPIGSHMIINDDKGFEGSVSGGCIEGSVIQESLNLLNDQTQKGKTLKFSVAQDTAWEVGLSCGGEISIYICKLDGSEDIYKKIDQREQFGILFDLVNHKHSFENNHSQNDQKTSLRDFQFFYRSYNAEYRMIVIGAVHVSQYLLEMSKMLDIETVIIDPRRYFSSTVRFKGANLIQKWPNEVLKEKDLDAQTALITLTHDPKIDDEALCIGLKSNAFYIGSLGSRKTHDQRLVRLREKGFSDAELNRIHAPIGLKIGGKSPAEIALSIISQVTRSIYENER